MPIRTLRSRERRMLPTDTHLTEDHMNSQETLVERDYDSSDAVAVFTLSCDDMRRTTLSLRGFGPSYTVNTDQSYTRTNFYRYGETTPLAVMEQRGILPDKITFNGKDRRNLGSWLKFSTLTIFPVTFKARGKKYVWKCTVDGKLLLYLFSCTNSPIAWFTASQTHNIGSTTISDSAYLTLRSEAMEIQDDVIVSFLILEHKSRESFAPSGDRSSHLAYYYDTF